VFGSGDPTPYDFPLIFLLVLLAILMFVGASIGNTWSPSTATLVRRGSMLVAIIAIAAVHIITPTTNGIVGAGRIMFLWPAIALAAIAFLVWSWRAGGL
jgi:hypothetical protein